MWSHRLRRQIRKLSLVVIIHELSSADEQVRWWYEGLFPIRSISGITIMPCFNGFRWIQYSIAIVIQLPGKPPNPGKRFNLPRNIQTS